MRALTSGAPLLSVAEPARLLLALARGALGRAVGDADAPHALAPGGRLVLAGVEAGVSRQEVWRASKHGDVRVERGKQQVVIAGPAVIDLIVDDDLVLRLLELDHLAELGRLGRLALADDLGRWLEQGETACPRCARSPEPTRIRPTLQFSAHRPILVPAPATFIFAPGSS